MERKSNPTTIILYISRDKNEDEKHQGVISWLVYLYFIWSSLYLYITPSLYRYCTYHPGFTGT